MKWLKLFSYVFHPIFMGVYGALFYFFITYSFFYDTQIYVTLVQVTILTFLLPISVYFLLKSLGVVKSFTEASLAERRVPIMVQIILLFVLLKNSLSVENNGELFYYFLGGIISAGLALLLVLFKFKVSLHMIGISAFIGFAYCLVIYYSIPFKYILAFFIVCGGLLASSRLYMKAHTNLELITGVFVGALPQYFLFEYSL